jgi:F-type H+-transporting ATPase subunit b
VILLAIGAGLSGAGPPPAAAAESTSFSINLFWVIVAALNFLVFFGIVSRLAFGPLSGMLAERKTRIEQGLRDAEQAARDRAAAQVEHEQIILAARRESNELIARAQKAAQELRDADIAATRVELQRLHEQAVADIAAERDHALAELRAQVADLALDAAGHVIGETMTDARQKRLVEEFLRDRSVSGGAGTAGGRGN